jgi:hypothetical protein
MGLLTGCSHLNHHFDCPLAPGVHCQPIHAVNAQLNQGRIAIGERGQDHQLQWSYHA